MHTRVSLGTAVRRRVAAISVTLLTAGVLATAGGVAAAAPQPTLTQAQQRLTQMENRASKLGQQYDQVKSELSSATQRLKLVNKESLRYRAHFEVLRTQVAEIAAAAYEQGGLSSPSALLTSGRPQQILNQSSILLELSSSNTAQMHEFLAAARQLTGAQQAARRAQGAILQLRNKLRGQKASLGKLIAQEQALVTQLTPAQRATTGPGGTGGSGGGGGGGGGGGAPPPYKGPTSTQAGKAVSFAYAQIGKPYEWGATGPNSYDCSGLTQAAWAYAGVSIPRTSYEQWDSLPHVSTSQLEPGDILVFAGASHVGIYVGGDELIDAPQTGMDVEKVALSGWYASELDGAVRP